MSKIKTKTFLIISTIILLCVFTQLQSCQVSGSPTTVDVQTKVPYSQSPNETIGKPTQFIEIIPSSTAFEKPTSDDRAWLTFDELTSGIYPQTPVDYQFFIPRSTASPPSHIFEGKLELSNTMKAANFVAVRDLYGYTDSPGRLHLPDLNIEFVQSGGFIIPVKRGLIITDSPFWNIIIEPGQVWDEDNDHGMTRASFPFSLVEKNANCTHNGVMTFLFDDHNVSKVYYQIAQETCYYFQGNFWGMADAEYYPMPFAGSLEIKSEFNQELAGRFPTKPFSELKIDYPDIYLFPFTDGITPESMTAYGLIVGGVNYIGGYQTRYGNYPYPLGMRLPSYSTAKSAFVGIVYMRLGEKYGEQIANLLIRDYIPEAASFNRNWTEITLDNILDLATGNYDSAIYMQDENSARMDEFFAAETYKQKISIALSWDHKTKPGTVWVYHTSDSFLAVQAMNNFLEEQEENSIDIYTFLVDEVYKPIGINKGAYTTLRTNEANWQGKPLGGYGLFWTVDDVAKITTFLNINRGRIKGTQLLNSELLANAMQLNPLDRGLMTSSPQFMYNNGFWAHEFTEQDGYSCNFWTPFMSGYGGITIVMMPNGVTYYYFSDNGEYDWYDAVAEVDRSIASNCVP